MWLQAWLWRSGQSVWFARSQSSAQLSPLSFVSPHCATAMGQLSAALYISLAPCTMHTTPWLAQHHHAARCTPVLLEPTRPHALHSLAADTSRCCHAHRPHSNQPVRRSPGRCCGVRYRRGRPARSTQEAHSTCAAKACTCPPRDAVHRR